MNTSKFCISAVFVIMLIFLSACGSASSKETDNFRGVKWGAEIGTLSGFEQVAEDGALRFFEKKGEELKSGDVRLSSIVYGFYNGRFYTAMVYFPAADFGKIKEVVSGQLGQPAQPEGDKGKIFWESQNVSVLLIPDAGSGDGRLSYLYKPIQLELELKK